MPRKRKVQRTPPSQFSKEEQPLSSYNYLRWLAGLTVIGLALILIYRYLTNQSGVAISHQEVERPSYLSASNNFFLPIENHLHKQPQESWIKSIKFAVHPSFEVPDPYINAENKRIAKEEITLQQQLLASLPLTPAQQAAVAEATIRLVPKTITPSGMVSYETGELLFGMVDYVTPAERRQTLLNEIHHLGVGYINKNKLKEGIKVLGKQLYYPFLNEQGAIDNKLKQGLETAISQLKTKVNELGTLLNKPRTPEEEDKLNTYLVAINNYQPQVIRAEFNAAEFHNKHASGDIRIMANKKLALKLPDGNTAYGYVHDQYADKIIVLYSLNKDHSPKELARSFIKDYQHKNNLLSKLYPLLAAARGERFDKNDELKEQASDIDELLTPEMKQVFAPAFVDYFDAYEENVSYGYRPFGSFKS